MTAAEGEDSFQVSVAVIFAAGGLWRRQLQIGVAEKFVEQRRDAAASQGEVRVIVEAAAAAREMRDESVDEHVGRAGIEGENLLRLGGARKDGDVGDASEVEENAAEFLVAIQKIVRVRDERCALAAKRDVCGTKIADSGNSRARGDDGWL